MLCEICKLKEAVDKFAIHWYPDGTAEWQWLCVECLAEIELENQADERDRWLDEAAEYESIAREANMGGLPKGVRAEPPPGYPYGP